MSLLRRLTLPPIAAVIAAAGLAVPSAFASGGSPSTPPPAIASYCPQDPDAWVVAAAGRLDGLRQRGVRRRLRLRPQLSGAATSGSTPSSSPPAGRTSSRRTATARRAASSSSSPRRRPGTRSTFASSSARPGSVRPLRQRRRPRAHDARAPQPADARPAHGVRSARCAGARLRRRPRFSSACRSSAGSRSGR